MSSGKFKIVTIYFERYLDQSFIKVQHANQWIVLSEFYFFVNYYYGFLLLLLSWYKIML